MKRPFLKIAAAALAAFLLFGCASTDTPPPGVTVPQVAIDAYLESETKAKESKRLSEALQRKVAPADLENMEEDEPNVAPAAPAPQTQQTYKSGLTLPIIMYHQVRNDKSGDMIISKGKLEEELAYLKRNGYVSVSPKEWLAYCDGKLALPERIVMLTFDDGWKSQYENALPLLNKYGYKGVFYVYPDFVGGSAAMNWDMIKKLAKAGHTVGCHSMTHPKLAPAEPNESKKNYKQRLKEEIFASADRISEKTGIDTLDFCFPYGYYSREVIDMLEDAGYRSAATVNAGKNDADSDPFTLSRYQVNQSTALSTFVSWLNEPMAEARLDSPGDGASNVAPGKECRLTLSDKLINAWKQGGELTVRCNHEYPQFRQEGRTLIFKAPKDDIRVTCYLKVKARDGRTYRRSFFFTRKR